MHGPTCIFRADLTPFLLQCAVSRFDAEVRAGEMVAGLANLEAAVARWEEAMHERKLMSTMQLSVGLDLVAEAVLTVPTAQH